MSDLQERYDDAMLDFTMADYDGAITGLESLLAEAPDYFDARLALGMAYYRKGDYGTAIVQGHKAEQLRPEEPLVHTNLSLFYMKSGDKQKAEHHGMRAKIANWKANMNPPEPGTAPGSSGLPLSQPKPLPVKLTARAGDHRADADARDPKS